MADETARKEVLEKLQQLAVNQLVEVCSSLGVTVAEAKKAKKESLFNAIIRYLSSEDIEDSDDGGMSIFLKLNDDLGKMGPDVKSNITSVATTVTEPKSEIKETTAASAKTKIELHKAAEIFRAEFGSSRCQVY